MRLESAQGLKQQLLQEIIIPFTTSEVFAVGARPLDTVPRIHRSIAIGVAPHNGEFRIAIRLQRPSLVDSSIVERLTREANGEIDVRLIGRLDKRAKTRRVSPRRPTRRAPHGRSEPGRVATAAQQARRPWYQLDARPVLIGASIGHVKITAGTTGAFVRRGTAAHVLSNNHVLANEDQAKTNDWILQRAPYDGGKQPAQRIARLKQWVRLKPTGTNFVDCAIAAIQPKIEHDAGRLRQLVNNEDRKLAGVATDPLEAGDFVYKVGRTTGPTRGRVTAFDVDNVVVGYDMGNLRFDNQLEIEGTGRTSFSDGGDSGSLIVNESMQAVGLLFAGGDQGGSNGLGLTYANPIRRVLSDLKATLLF
jgi:hypothetical protein